MRRGIRSVLFVEAALVDGSWVDDYLLSRRGRDICLWFDKPVSYAGLGAQVRSRAGELAEAGLRPGGTISLRLPPSLAYVVSLLAAWRVGAQVSLLDHRLTEHEVGQALRWIQPQLVVSWRVGALGDGAGGWPAGPLRGHTSVTPVTEPYHGGRPAGTPYALLQLSSGSTGPSKVIGRTAADLCTEVERYQLIDGTPQAGERVVLLASMVHVLGLVGGLLYGLHAGVQLVLPRSISTGAILAAVAAGPEPTTIIGVPFHIDFLTAAGEQPRLPQLKRLTVGGELVRPPVRQAFLDRHGVPLGVMYGMTEAGVMATDLAGGTWPALTPAPGMSFREESGELLLAMKQSPYVGRSDPTRWVDRWLYTRDAGMVDPVSGRVTVRGRLDSQVSVGGLKVDLTEVEQTLAGSPEVTEAVVAHDGAIEAFVVLRGPESEPAVRSAIVARLAPYKRPRRLTIVDRLPRTATGKLVRNITQLRRAAEVGRQERSGADVR